jgi:uncharacterized integral membrane protein
MNADQIAEVLDELQARLSGPAAYAFGLVVRQVAIEGAINIAFAVVGLVVTLLIFRFSGRCLKAVRTEHDKYPMGSEEFPLLAFLGAAALGGLVLLMTLGCGANAAKFLLNPEYAALERLLSLIP